jgi:hypothetical protein
MDSAVAALFAAPAPTPEQLAARNAPYVTAGAQPVLTPPGVTEPGFQAWLAQNRVPYDPSPTADYDMRGFFNTMRRGDSTAAAAIDPNDQRLHYPDTYKMPNHPSFSGESRWAGPVAPQWNAQDQLVSPGGRILFDDRAQQLLRALGR